MTDTVPGEETPEELEEIRQRALERMGGDPWRALRNKGHCSCLDVPVSHKPGCGGRRR